MDGEKQKLDSPETIFQLKVSLLEIHPLIWRRLAVPMSITFHKLHKILQVAMGWQGYHQYNFTVGNVYYGIPDLEFAPVIKDSRRVKLQKVISGKIVFTYVYDFGDTWEHKIQVEKISRLNDNKLYPVCMEGERACPPEGVGGTWGYRDLLKALSDPDHQEYEDLLTLAGGKFDPEHFDLQAVNEKLGKLR